MIRHALCASTALAVVIVAQPALAQSGAAVANTPAASDGGPTPAAQPADAQAGQLADIVITATKRETTLEKTPIAVSAFDQRQLDQYQVKDVTTLSQFVPSLAFNKQGDQSAITLTLRGIGNDSAYTEVADPEVAIYVDGVYSPRAQGASVLAYDLQRIEVLRGPQGTLFGRNATVGAVSFITAKPEFDGVKGYAEFLGGDYNRIGSQGMINLPVTDTLAVRLAFITDRNDGYIHYQQPPNVVGVDRSAYVTSGPRYYATDQKSARLSVEWRPSDRFRWDLNGEYFKDTGTPILGLMQTPRPGQDFWSALIDTAPEQDRYSVSIHSNMSYDLSDSVQLAYIAGYQKVGGTTQVDADAGTEPPSAADPQNLPNGAFEENRTVSSSYQFYSHEVQIKSIGTHPIDWIAGGYFSHETNAIRFDVDIRNGYREGTFNYAGSFIQIDRTIESKAGFGQVVWHVTPHIRLTGGLRYTDDDKRDVGGRNVTSYLPTCSAADTAANGTCGGLFGIAPNDTAQQLEALLGPNWAISPNDAHGNWDKLTYLARADADFSRNTFGYASISTGFKSGNIEDGGLLAGPESLTNYEIGLKQQFLDGRATLNLAAYYSDFTGYQVNQAVSTRNAAGQITGSQLITTNAQGATAKGIEAELAANVSRDDHVQIAADVQKTRLKTLYTVDGRLYNNSNPADIENLEGNELPHAPRFAITGTYIHDFELGNGARLSPRATVHYETASWLTYFNGDVASRYADPAHVSGNYGTAFDRQTAYAKVDLALSYTPDNRRYVVELFGQNVTDQRIRLSAGSYGAPANPVFLSNYAPPATYGGRIRLNF